MRLYVDCSHAFRAPARRGIDRVVTKVLDHAPAICAASGVECHPVAWSEDGSFRIIPAAAAQRNVERVERVKLRTVDVLERARLHFVRLLLRSVYRFAKRSRMRAYLRARPAVRFQSGDVLFCPDANWMLPAEYMGSLQTASARIVPLFYDLIPVTHPQYLVAEHVAMFRRWLDDLVAVADFGLAISDTTARAVEEHAARQRVELEVRTTYLGADFDVMSREPGARDEVAKVMTSKPYLVVGALEPRKNHELVYRAFQLLWQRGSGAALCFIGAVTPLAEPFVEELRASPQWGSRVFVLEGVDDEELSFCYRNATALIASSIAEGFDLPAVEALHHSLPVLASRTPVHEEIVGATVAYFERAEDLAGQIEHGPPPAGGEFKWLGWEESVRGMVESLLQQPVYELDTGL